MIARYPNGLQASDWLQIELKKERKAQAIPARLDPAWPYANIPFDPEFFGLEANPQPPVT